MSNTVLPSRRPFVIASIMLATFMAAIEATIVATAMPHIVGQLGGFTYYSWVFSAFLLAQSTTTVIYGKLSDIFGRKPVLMLGMVLFLAGSLLCGLANSMGLSFSMNVDPLRGSSTPALGQLYIILATLTFLALDGHAALIELLVGGLYSLPVGMTGLGQQGLWSLILWFGQLFAGAIAVALPGITALLIVNLAFGVVSRAAPSLNLFAVGFPVSLVVGLLVVLAGIGPMQDSFMTLLAQGFEFLRSLHGGP